MKIEHRSLADITPYERNPRVNDGAVDAVAESIRHFGFRQPIVVDGDGVIVCGHTRWKAAQKLGLDDVPVHVVTDLTPEQIRALRIADNKSGELATWDLELLPLELAELTDAGVDWSLLGFDADDLAQLLDPGVAPGLTDPDDVPEPPDEAITRPGDVWILGNHRLMCGDSGSTADVDRLLDGAPVHLVNTDPPYGVSHESRSKNAIAAGLSSFPAAASKRNGKRDQPRKLQAKDRPIANDSVSDEEYAELLRAWFGQIGRVLLPGRCAYLWGGYANCANYPAAMKEAGLYFSQAVIWDKQHPVLSRKDFMGAHEWCFYSWKEGAAHVFLGPNNVPDLWHVKKLNPRSMRHITEKPTELAVRAIQYSSRPGENVLDLFGGSGSTLIAAEQTGRRAYLMEIDPLYADVICDRFQRFTGTPAMLERTGESPIPMKPREEDVR